MKEIGEFTKTRQAVDEKWWHRLLRVLIYASTSLVVVISGFFVSHDPGNYTHSYSYSFESNFEAAEGEEQTCHYYRHNDSVLCGELETLGNLLLRFRTAKQDMSRAADPDSRKTDSLGNSPTTAKRFNAENDAASLGARQALIELLDRGSIRYRHATHWKMPELVQAVGLTFGISTLWYLFTLAIYKVLLFVVHGHTRVRRT